MKTKLIIFDLDNTLYNEEDYLKSGYKAVAKILANKVERSEKNIYNRMLKIYRSGGGFETFQKYLIENQHSIELLPKMIEKYRYHKPSITITKRKVQLLKKLSSSGRKLALITNGDADRQMLKIKALGIDGYFDYILITGKYLSKKYWKPNPRGYKEILSKLNCRAKETVFVGDNPEIDIEYPLVSGMTAIITTEYVQRCLLKNKRIIVIQKLNEVVRYIN